LLWNTEERICVVLRQKKATTALPPRSFSSRDLALVFTLLLLQPLVLFLLSPQ
jgi:hypothetical protein